ncbi:methyltransferase, TIGR04325 family [uncultured Helicobacter sp.]|uniref:methyltransferase, TIGR04325 family n=2 Tax=uncultured Helicobacter sp. TaxID=175537 RepID=UPI0026F3D46E|nr:methyltransferase, TIGR04325 family [uncultured Helicobacter sp.]
MKKILKSLLNFCKDIYHYLHFPNAYIAYRGVYTSFEEALECMPKTKGRNKGYIDTPQDILQSWCEMFKKPIALVDTEYPLFFHLDRILAQNPKAKVCDFGGANGRHYFAYTSYNALKPQWEVVELESNVSVGNAMVKELKIENLSFSTNLSPSNILLSSSAFQYVKNIWELLDKFALLSSGGGATHILLTRIPLQSKTHTFITLQNALNQYYLPLYIFNRDEFIGFFTSRGYRLVDEWKDPFDSSMIPFHRDISVYQYSGLCFEKD